MASTKAEMLADLLEIRREAISAGRSVAKIDAILVDLDGWLSGLGMREATEQELSRLDARDEEEIDEDDAKCPF